jgi:FkbM family methyltransferase
MTSVLRPILGSLPDPLQRELRRLHYARQIRRGRFGTDEPEYDMLERWVRAGDTVLDVGANIGRYTMKLSALVGPQGRVIAVEPVAETFVLLSENVSRSPHGNVTLLNVAASSGFEVVGMTVPRDSSGIENLYQASIDGGTEGGPRVLTAPMDALRLPSRISLAKIDVEGHELAALAGMDRILTEDRPVLIVEDSSAEIQTVLTDRGYESTRFDGSPNRLYLSATAE